VNYAFPNWSSKALLEIGRVLEAKGLKADAVARYQEVVQKYGNTDSGAVAQERLKQLVSLSTKRN
jgi:TolA-binding protein